MRVVVLRQDAGRVDETDGIAEGRRTDPRLSVPRQRFWLLQLDNRKYGVSVALGVMFDVVRFQVADEGRNSGRW